MRAYAKKTTAPGLSSPFGRMRSSRAVPVSQANNHKALAINPPGDEYEQEADRVADQVMGKSALPPAPLLYAGAAITSPQAGQSDQPLAVQRSASWTTGKAAAPARIGEMLSSAGQPLAGEPRASMEARFAHNFSQVRIHADRPAADAAQSIGARAFTAGNHITFDAGQYRPHTPEGGWLLAHELTHVLQQRTASPVIQRAEADDNPDFCFPPDGQPALEDVGSVLNSWIAEAQEYGKQNNLAGPAAIDHELAQLADPLTTIAERRIAELPQGQVRHVSLDESRYRIPAPLRKFYRSQGKSPVSPVINLCGVCVGSDKVGHFFQQGGEYFRIGEALRQRIQTWTPEERAAFLDQLAPGSPEDGVDLSPVLEEDRVIEIYTDEYGKWLEGFPNRLPDQEIAWIRSNKLIPGNYFGGIYGWASSGVMSRGDLEANLQGGRFYRDAMRYPDQSLELCNYVNDGWNEYANPSSYGGVGLFDPISGPELPVDAIGDKPSDHPVIDLPQEGVAATIPFKTDSDYPDDAAMESLVSRMMWYPDNLKRGEFHIDFAGYASRLGDAEHNQELSERRAQTVKGRLQFLIGMALENFDFEFNSGQFSLKGYGEPRAPEAGKSPNDDSQSDRVVKVVFEIK